MTEVTRPAIENERSYRGLNFLDARDFKVPAIISRGEHIAYKGVIAAGFAIRNLVLASVLS